MSGALAAAAGGGPGLRFTALRGASGRGTALPSGVVAALPECYAVHMKRTNLVLSEELLEEATRLSGEKTYSRTVDRALEEFIKRHKARQILSLAGSGLWTGALGEMRGDKPRRRKKAKR